MDYTLKQVNELLTIASHLFLFIHEVEYVLKQLIMTICNIDDTEIRTVYCCRLFAVNLNEIEKAYRNRNPLCLKQLVDRITDSELMR